MKKLLFMVFMTFLSVCLVQATTGLNLTAPNGGESWTVGSSPNITWSSSGISENIKIKLYKGGISFGGITSNTADDGTYSWTIPAILNGHPITTGSDYKIRIETVSESYFDVSAGNFTITAPGPASLTLVQPNGPEDWEIGKTKSITWTSPGISENIKLKLYKGSVSFGGITSNTDDDGAYSWKIPTSLNGNTITPDSDYKVRIETVSESYNDTSDSTFTISPASSGGSDGPSIYSYRLVIDSPKATSKWRVGKTYPIRWKRLFLISIASKVKVKPKWIPMPRPQVEKQQLKVAKFKDLLQLIKSVKIEYRRVSCKLYPIKTAKYILWHPIKSNAFDGKYGGTFNWPIPSAMKSGCYQIKVTENKAKPRSARSKTFQITKLILKPGVFKEYQKKKQL